MTIHTHRCLYHVNDVPHPFVQHYHILSFISNKPRIHYCIYTHPTPSHTNSTYLFPTPVDDEDGEEEEEEKKPVDEIKPLKKKGFFSSFGSKKNTKSGKGDEKKSGKDGGKGSEAGGSEKDKMIDDDKDNIFEETSVEGAVHVKKTGMFSFLQNFTKEKAEGEGRIDVDNEELVREEEELIADQVLEDKLGEVRFKDFEEVSRVQARFENERKLLQRAELRRFFHPFSSPPLTPTSHFSQPLSHLFSASHPLSQHLTPAHSLPHPLIPPSHTLSSPPLTPSYPPLTHGSNYVGFLVESFWNWR